MPQIKANRDRIAALLGLRDEWKQPDEVYADEAWEVSIVWRSGYGRVEIGTAEDGSVGYYVRRARGRGVIGGRRSGADRAAPPRTWARGYCPKPTPRRNRADWSRI